MSARPARARSCSTCWPSRSIRRTSRCAAAITGCGRPCRQHRAPNVSAGSPPSGPASAAFKPGDIVINMQRENWTQRRRIDAEDAIPLPAGLDLDQAAMLRINPPTALLLLEDHVALKPGEWVIQNVANSAVGRHLIVLAKHKRLRTAQCRAARRCRRRAEEPRRRCRAASTAPISRRAPMTRSAARRSASASTPSRAPRANASPIASRMAAVVVSYGSMSGEDPVMSRPALNFRGVSLTGFNLGRGLAKRSPRAGARDLCRSRDKLRDGVLKAPIEATYPIEDIKQALAHAQRGGRNGKVLVLPNGRLGAS